MTSDGRAAPDRGEISHPRFVGRERELVELVRARDQSSTAVVLIEGEAGVGKALEAQSPRPFVRLARHFREAGDTERWCRYAEQASESGDQMTATASLHELIVHAELPPTALGPISSKLGDGALRRRGTVNQLHTQVGATLLDVLVPAACRVEPLIFLRYEAGVDLTNSVPAPGVHQFTVLAYRQAEDGPTIMGLSLWTSIDGGETWRPAQVVQRDRGRNGAHEYRVIATYPQVRKTNGSVSLRAESWDDDGNRVWQRIDCAFDLTPA